MGNNTSYHVERFGLEQEPIVVIDDFYPDFEALRQNAALQTYQRLGQFYPGIRASADSSYLGERRDLLSTVLLDIFDCTHGARVTESAYSIVTTPRENLTPIQSLPHYDGCDPNRLAVLHYLSPSETGGTALYRHRSTGFETITEDRFSAYKSALNNEALESARPATGYFGSSTKQFERLGHINAKPNRLIIYRGVTLHSGIIPDDLDLKTNPLHGRLTINTFLLKRSTENT